MKYRALTAIKFNGRAIAQDGIVDLMEAEAAPLVADGLLQKIETTQPVAAPPKEDTSQ